MTRPGLIHGSALNFGDGAISLASGVITVGILLLASSAPVIFILGIFVLSLGVTLQAGATGAVRAIKLSATLTAAGRPSDARASKS